MTTIPIRAANRNPIPKYMVGSIMEHAPPTRALIGNQKSAAGPDGRGGYPKGDIASRLQKVTTLPRNFGSERIPGRLRRELEVADVRPKPQTNARTDRHNDDVAGGKCSHAKSANEISRAVDAAKSLIDRLRGR